LPNQQPPRELIPNSCRGRQIVSCTSGKFLSEGFVLRYFAAFCVPADFTDLRLISQKHGKSGQIADVCSSQIVVKICEFTTKDFADDYIIAYFSVFA